ncbi:MAG: hypothetical protein JNN30_04790 [Rhodanobacteraceae bacterium]|nr:hypothetical protein [Rhodanobacteraceae bacterium]
MPLTQTAQLATAVAGFAHAWAGLLDQELALAQRSLRWFLIAAIAVPVVAFSVWLNLSAIVVAAAYVYSDSWPLSLLMGAGVQSLALAMLLHLLRRWTRDLTLPHSRAALLHAVERMT